MNNRFFQPQPTGGPRFRPRIPSLTSISAGPGIGAGVPQLGITSERSANGNFAEDVEITGFSESGSQENIAQQPKVFCKESHSGFAGQTTQRRQEVQHHQQEEVPDMDGSDSEDEDYSHCKYCNVDLKNMQAYQTHIRGMLHTQKVMDAKKNKKRTPADGGESHGESAGQATQHQQDVLHHQQEVQHHQQDVQHHQQEVQYQQKVQEVQHYQQAVQHHLQEEEPDMDGSDSEDEDYSHCKYCNVDLKNMQAYQTHIRGMLHTQHVMDAKKNKKKPSADNTSMVVESNKSVDGTTTSTSTYGPSGNQSMLHPDYITANTFRHGIPFSTGSAQSNPLQADAVPRGQSPNMDFRQSTPIRGSSHAGQGNTPTRGPDPFCQNHMRPRGPHSGPQNRMRGPPPRGQSNFRPRGPLSQQDARASRPTRPFNQQGPVMRGPGPEFSQNQRFERPPHRPGMRGPRPEFSQNQRFERPPHHSQFHTDMGQFGDEPPQEQQEDEEDDEEEEDTKHCKYCDINFDSSEAYHRHTRGMLHTQKVMDSKVKKGKLHVDYVPDRPVVFQKVEVSDKERMPPQLSTSNSAKKQVEEDNWMDDVDERKLRSIPLAERDLKPDDLGKIQFPDEYCCQLCDVKCTGAVTLKMHMEGSRHKMNVALAEKGEQLKKKKGSNMKLVTTGATGNVSDMIKNYSDAPLLGLQYVVEFRQKGRKTSRFVCNLCQGKCDGNTVIPHCLGAKHRLRYLKEHHTPIYEHLTKYNSIKKKSEMSEAIDMFAKDIEEKYGRGEVRVQIEEEEDGSADVTLEAIAQKAMETAKTLQKRALMESSKEEDEEILLKRAKKGDTTDTSGGSALEKVNAKKKSEVSQNYIQRPEDLRRDPYKSDLESYRYDMVRDSRERDLGRDIQPGRDSRERDLGRDIQPGRDSRERDLGRDIRPGGRFLDTRDANTDSPYRDYRRMPDRDPYRDDLRERDPYRDDYRGPRSDRDLRSDKDPYRRDDVQHVTEELDPLERYRDRLARLDRPKKHLPGGLDESDLARLNRLKYTKGLNTADIIRLERMKGLDSADISRLELTKGLNSSDIDLLEKSKGITRADNTSRAVEMSVSSKKAATSATGPSSTATSQSGSEDLKTGNLNIQGLLSSLSDSMISSEDDASMALQVSNALTQALLQYRMKQIPKELSGLSNALESKISKVTAKPAKSDQQKQKELFDAYSDAQDFVAKLKKKTGTKTPTRDSVSFKVQTKPAAVAASNPLAADKGGKKRQTQSMSALVNAYNDADDIPRLSAAASTSLSQQSKGSSFNLQASIESINNALKGITKQQTSATSQTKGAIQNPSLSYQSQQLTQTVSQSQPLSYTSPATSLSQPLSYTASATAQSQVILQQYLSSLTVDQVQSLQVYQTQYGLTNEQMAQLIVSQYGQAATATSPAQPTLTSLWYQTQQAMNQGYGQQSVSLQTQGVTPAQSHHPQGVVPPPPPPPSILQKQHIGPPLPPSPYVQPPLPPSNK